MKALLVYANGSEDLEITAPADILSRGGVKVVRAALSDAGTEVTLAHGTKVVCDVRLADVLDQDFDIIVIPGGYEGSLACRDCAPLIDRLKKQQSEGKWLAAICAAPGFVLASHGLIGDSVQATGYPGCTDGIKNLVSAGVCRDAPAKLITGKGPAYAYDFAFAILEELAGAAKTAEVKAGMLWAN